MAVARRLRSLLGPQVTIRRGYKFRGGAAEPSRRSALPRPLSKQVPPPRCRDIAWAVDSVASPVRRKIRARSLDALSHLGRSSNIAPRSVNASTTSRSRRNATRLAPGTGSVQRHDTSARGAVDRPPLPSPASCGGRAASCRFDRCHHPIAPRWRPRCPNKRPYRSTRQATSFRSISLEDDVRMRCRLEDEIPREKDWSSCRLSVSGSTLIAPRTERKRHREGPRRDDPSGLPARYFYVAADRSHSRSFDQRRRPETLRIAMATAFFWPTRTTSRLPG
jgi:hypothetical protein